MKGFICVYLHPKPNSQALIETKLVANNNGNLKQYLSEYGNPDCFYDWGDDPGFFSATKIFGRPEFAS